MESSAIIQGVGALPPETGAGVSLAYRTSLLRFVCGQRGAFQIRRLKIDSGLHDLLRGAAFLNEQLVVWDRVPDALAERLGVCDSLCVHVSPFVYAMV
jgi:hypothetical protein